MASERQLRARSARTSYAGNLRNLRNLRIKNSQHSPPAVLTLRHWAQLQVLINELKGFGSKATLKLVTSGTMGDMLTDPLMKDFWDRYRHKLPEPLRKQN